MIFCTYCGKRFTRKEHLERHIPSHTDVKPHRCKSCQLSFTRRDLLQRHYSAYHEIGDQSPPPPASIKTVARQTPIACLNCASAKTSCDKRVPCARCADKSLPCEARFTRRPSTLMMKAMASSKASKQAPESTAPKPLQHYAIATPPENNDIVNDTRLHSAPAMEIESLTPQIFSTGTAGEPGSTRISGVDGFVQYNDGIASPVLDYQDPLTCDDLSMDMNLYGNLTYLLPENMHQQGGDISPGSDISSGSIHYQPSTPHTGSCSISSADNVDVEDVQPSKRAKQSYCAVTLGVQEPLAAEQGWPLARCNPPTLSDSCLRTTVMHLERLGQNSKHERAWDSLDLEPDLAMSASDFIKVEPINSGTRDTLHAITLGFLYRALKTHRGGFTDKFQNGHYLSLANFGSRLLPPANVLEYFLLKYTRNLSKYYSLDAMGRIDSNELIHGNHTSTLLMLLMIGQGASMSRSAEARCLSAGLTEICRISLFDITQQDIELCADQTVLQCALLFTMLGAWSGDKWHMDIAMGQRGMYLTMLKHAGMLEPQDVSVQSLSGSPIVDVQWRAWVEAEARSRLVYDWVLLDQELSLFHDMSAILSVSELHVLLPHPDLSLFSASSAHSWSTLLSTSTTSHIRTSLYELFQEFLHDHLLYSASLTPLTLRLLLHPIQSLLYEVRQLLTCFSEVLPTWGSSTRTPTKPSTLMRLEEVQSLLQKWYNLHLSLPPSVSGSADDSAKTTNLILYHLISLNAHTSFPSLEQLARRAPATLATANLHWNLSLQHKKCIFDSVSALFHAGQILHLVTLFDSPDRTPPWASLAVYRASLVIWFDVLAMSDPSFQLPTADGPIVVINERMVDDAALMRWLRKIEGLPVLRRQDGSMCKLQDPEVVLEACIGLVGGMDEGGNRRGGMLADGIKRKLQTLKGNWHSAGGLHGP
ncbi:hypothetical protein V490_05239 [Pseudogymnoascus sp. VKM F-3557]|nr:hypothetical protein V490_05239 [Pseudogymnoascus sp. VKM F-3557]